jgi:hypothetical protein
MWWCFLLHEVQVFIVNPTKKQLATLYCQTFQVVVPVHCVPYLLYNHPVHSDVKVTWRGYHWSQ